jgi:dihydroneopterin aldolase
VATIQLRGLSLLGVHGVLPEEQQRAQPFEVDIDLTVDISKAAATDALEDTIDYGEITTMVARVVNDESYALIEKLATRIGEVCRTDPRVTGVIVTVKKMRPPVPEHLEYSAVRVEL